MIMIKKAWILPLILFTAVGLSGIAEARLIKIGAITMKGAPSSAGGSHPGSAVGSSAPAETAEGDEYSLIYEDDTGLIWMDYTHMGQSWYPQVEWAAGLNEPGVLTYNLEPGISVSWEGDWRLPATLDGARRFGYDGTTTAGFNITSSELGHLYYKSLGNLGYYDTQGNERTGWHPDSEWGPKNKGPFTNLQNSMYWSGTEYSLNPQLAWVFNFAFGDQTNNALKAPYPYFGIAVRPGKAAWE